MIEIRCSIITATQVAIEYGLNEQEFISLLFGNAKIDTTNILDMVFGVLLAKAHYPNLLKYLKDMEKCV